MATAALLSETSYRWMAKTKIERSTMSLCENYRDVSERGAGNYTIVAYRASSASYHMGYVQDSYDSELRCIECDTEEEINEALVRLEKENLNKKHRQLDWVVRIYRGPDLTIYRSPEDNPEGEVFSIDFKAIEAQAECENEETQRTIIAVRMITAHEEAEKKAREEEEKERKELERLVEKYGLSGVAIPE